MVDESLMANEKVVYSTQKHWAAPVANSWEAVLMILGAILLSWLQPDSTGTVMGFISRVIELLRTALFLGGVVWIVYNVIAWRTASVKVTNLRILGHEGLLRSRSTDTLLSGMADVRTKSTMVGRMLGYGDISIYTASGEAGADAFTSIRDVETLKRHILEQKTNAHATPAPTPQAATSQPDPTVALMNLGQLRDAGVITPVEFEAKKQELMARL